MPRMKASLAWLAELVPGLPALEEVAERLTRGGVEVMGWRSLADDVQLELAPPGNRPDVRSHHGLALELCALLHRSPRVMAPRLEPIAPEAASELELCAPTSAGYRGVVARLLSGVTDGPSPTDWARRLEVLELRSSGVVLDATALAMAEHGVLVHALDLDRIEGRRLVLRVAAPGESLELPARAPVVLHGDDLVLVDERGPIALVGVETHARARFRRASRRALLVAALPEPRRVQQSARRHGLRIPAAMESEGGVDPAWAVLALDRAAEHIVAHASARVHRGRLGAITPISERRVPLRLGVVRELVGVELERAELVGRLRRLGLGVDPDALTADTVQVSVPARRPDLGTEVDLVEELVRLQDLDALPSCVPHPPAGEAARPAAPEEVVRRTLLDRGFAEWICLAFVGADAVRPLDPTSARPVELADPLCPEHRFLRTSLVPGLLRAALLQPRERHVLAFELGRAFAWGQGDEPLPRQPLRVALVHRDRAGAGSPDALAAHVERLLVALGMSGARRVARPVAWAEARAGHHWVLGSRSVGWEGTAAPELAGSLAAPCPALVELDLDAIRAGEGCA